MILFVFDNRWSLVSQRELDVKIEQGFAPADEQDVVLHLLYVFAPMYNCLGLYNFCLILFLRYRALPLSIPLRNSQLPLRAGQLYEGRLKEAL